jgi:hypothetical protein
MTRTGLLFALALTAAGTAPALAQSSRYATDPDPAVYNTLAREHMNTFNHNDAVLPRTSAVRVAASSNSSRYATDPDPAIYNTLAREHMNTFNHYDAVLPKSTIRGDWRALVAPLPYGSAGSASQPGFNTSFDRSKGSL